MGINPLKRFLSISCKGAFLSPQLPKARKTICQNNTNHDKDNSNVWRVGDEMSYAYRWEKWTGMQIGQKKAMQHPQYYNNNKDVGR